MGAAKVIKLSKFDRQIMSLLQMRGRMEFTKMAEILNVSVGLVHQRFKYLIKSGVITRTTYTFNHKIVGLNLYRVLFKLIQFDQDRMNEFYNFCVIHPNINHYIKTMGNWDLMLDIEIKNREKLRDLLLEIKHNFKDILARVEINEIYALEKFNGC